jgi:acetylornithine aminotransferase/acetylornithine/N-succinyldiaminopimelate aminotransferase
MLEPVQGEGGVYVADKKYLQSVRKLCDAEGILFILDEVQTGMGRTGTLFAYEQYGVEPDIMTLAKGLASGLPIGAILAREEVASAFGPGDHGSTFGGGPVACAAALATLDVLFQDNLIENASRVGAYFREKLEQLTGSDTGIAEVRGMGLMLALELREGRAEEIAQIMLERGLVINHIGEKILRFLPPLSISTREVDILIKGLTETLSGRLA